MKYKVHVNKQGKEVVKVYRQSIKESQHFGNIEKTKVCGISFIACGPENIFLSEELREIADKLDELKKEKK